MTAQKQVASSIKSILEHPVVVGCLDKGVNISPFIEEVKNWWGYDLHSRKPSPAYDDDGMFTGTDLDLACFLYELAGRGAVINIPTYKGHSQKKDRVDQVVTSQYNRHGKLINVGAHKEFFSFNIKIIDENVVGEDKVGEFRTFSLTDKDGSWYDGWKTIQFNPTLRENRFLTENKLFTGNHIYFKNFIHPNRWTSVFGKYYLITKILSERLEDEAAFLYSEIKRLQAAGIKFPEETGPKSAEYEYGKGKQEKFTAFEMKVYIPDYKYIGEYQKVDESQEGLVNAYNQRKSFVYNIGPQLRFMTRASEYAHFKNPDRFPAWIKNVQWEDGFKIPPRGRSVFQRLKLFQDAVGEHSISLLKRTYQKSATVGADD